jgi:hypothetical protein
VRDGVCGAFVAVFALADVETRGWGNVCAATSVLVVVAGDWMAVVVIARVINNVMRRVEGGEVISACIF